MLKGKTALVTGGSRGIGRAIALKLAENGADVAIVYAGRQDAAEETRRDIEALGVKAAAYQCDVADFDAVKAVVAAVGKDFGGVDILVNNAGFGVFGKFSETALQEELELLQVNVRALHILTKLFLRDFKKRNFGKILNVASSAGFLTGPLFSSYYASKNYVVRLSLAIAEELRREKSRVTISILCPGPVDTGFNDRAGVQFRVKALTPEAVAKEAVFGLLTGKLLIIPGLMMRVGVAASKLVPEKLLSRILYHVQAAKQPEHK